MFCVGDRVVATTRMTTFDDAIRVGDTGTVVLKDTGDDVAVEWDTYIGGHSLGDRCRQGHGWRTIREYIKLLEEDKELEPPTDIAALFA